MVATIPKLTDEAVVSSHNQPRSTVVLRQVVQPAESGIAANYDCTKEDKRYARKFAEQLALPKTAELMATLRAALAAAAAAVATAGGSAYLKPRSQ